jgi:D-aspartate ligase
MLMPPDMDVTVPVLVLKLSRNVLQHGTLGVIRSLGSLGVPVYALVEDRFAPAAMSRYLAGGFVWEIRGLDAEQLVIGLTAIGERLGRPGILVPTDDLAAVLIAEHSQALENWFRFPRLPRELPRRLANKRDLYFLCRKLGVPCPETVFPGSLDDVHGFIERATFPVVVKAPESQRLRKGARSVSIVQTPRELLTIYRRAENPETPKLILQEYIPESCAEDWVFQGYRNPRTECFIAFTGKKLRSYPPFAGPTTLGVPVLNESLSRQTETLLSEVGYAGIMDIDYRLDKRDGQYKLVDFNPRVGANFRMFENHSGVDVVRALHLDLTGRSVSPSPAVESRTFVVEPYDLLASLGYIRRGSLTVREWRRSLQGTREAAWFRGDDPVPWLTMCVRLLFRGAGRLVQRGRARICASWSRPTDRRSRGVMASDPPPVTQRPPTLGIAGEPVLSERK